MDGLTRAIDAAARRYGSLNKAARVLDLDVSYLSRLRNGLRDNPSDAVLRALGIERRVVYVKRKRPRQEPLMEG
jgi:hypothetical protein